MMHDNILVDGDRLIAPFLDTSSPYIIPSTVRVAPRADELLDTIGNIMFSHALAERGTRKHSG
jgi:hypothetical protein